MIEAGQYLNAEPAALDGEKHQVPDRMRANCTHEGCDGVVVVSRAPTMELKLGSARCTFCGRHYSIENAPEW